MNLETQYTGASPPRALHVPQTEEIIGSNQKNRKQLMQLHALASADKTRHAASPSGSRALHAAAAVAAAAAVLVDQNAQVQKTLAQFALFACLLVAANRRSALKDACCLQTEGNQCQASQRLSAAA